MSRDRKEYINCREVQIVFILRMEDSYFLHYTIHRKGIFSFAFMYKTLNIFLFECFEIYI